MRLFVTGPTGSGKSSLATQYARKASLPIFSLDEIHWVRLPGGEVRREPAQRLALLEEIARGDDWVIEGVQFKWADPAMERAHRIVVLDVPRWRNTLRILHRFQRRYRSLEISGRGTLKALKEELRWSSDYYTHERAMLFEKLNRWPGKLMVLRGHQDDRILVEALRMAV